MDSTINRELSALKRMYHLGQKQDPPLVARLPNIEILKENNVRTGFFAVEDFETLRGALPDHLKVVATIGYYTGMRLSRIFVLRWDQIDWDHGMLRLGPGTSQTKKVGHGSLIPELLEVLEHWRLLTLKRSPQCPWVCHYNGKKISRIYRAWRTARKRVGLEEACFTTFADPRCVT